MGPAGRPRGTPGVGRGDAPRPAPGPGAETNRRLSRLSVLLSSHGKFGSRLCSGFKKYIYPIQNQSGWESARLALPWAEAFFLTGNGWAAYSDGAWETVQITCQC